MDDSRIRTAAELISALVSPQAAEAAGTWAKVTGFWPRLAGERAAAHSRITDIVNHSVLVEADHPGWIQLLQFRQSEILKEIRKEFSSLDIRGIQFHLSQPRGPAVPATPSAERDTSRAAGDEEGMTETPVHVNPDAIQDETLKKAIFGLLDALDER